VLALLLAANPYTEIIDRSVDVPAIIGAERFLRRAAVELLARPPTLEELEAFAGRPRSDVVERWIRSDEAAAAWASSWTEILIDPNARALRPSFTAWLAAERRRRAPWSDTVTKLVTASGHRRESPPVSFLLAFGSVEEATGGVARLFLGSSIACAQCHDHPDQDVRMREHYGLLAFFAKSRVRGVTIFDVDRGQAVMPNGDVVLPRFPGGPSMSLDTGEARRAALARLIVASPRFAEATVNRAWAEAMGRGLVENVDDLDDASEETSGRALLALLADRFRVDCDLETLIAGIVGSRAFQSDAIVPHGFEPRPKSPEQVIGSLASLAGLDRPAAWFEAARFVRATGGEPSIPRTAMIMNDRGLQIGLHHGTSAALASIEGADPKEAVRRLFLIVLSREPTDAEERAVVGSARDPRGIEDILWALAVSAEAQTHL
jgi:hypothetical protein